MAYNKAKEEYKWKVWKEQEEKKLRELGVSEEVIAELRDYDWNCFKQERNYKNHQMPDTDFIERTEDASGKWEIQQPVNVQDFIKSLDDNKLRKDTARSLGLIRLRLWNMTRSTVSIPTSCCAISPRLKPGTVLTASWTKRPMKGYARKRTALSPLAVSSSILCLPRDWLNGSSANGTSLRGTCVPVG